MDLWKDRRRRSRGSVLRSFPAVFFFSVFLFFFFYSFFWRFFNESAGSDRKSLDRTNRGSRELKGSRRAEICSRARDFRDAIIDCRGCRFLRSLWDGRRGGVRKGVGRDEGYDGLD